MGLKLNSNYKKKKAGQVRDTKFVILGYNSKGRNQTMGAEKLLLLDCVNLLLEQFCKYFL